METIHPIQGSFGSEFPAIYNHCRVMAPESQDVKHFPEICAFLEKRPLTVKFSKFCSKRFHRDTDRRVVFKYREWNLADGKSVKLCVAYPTTTKKTKFRLALQLSLLRGSRPNVSGLAPDDVPRVLQILSKSVHFRRRYRGTREHRQNAP